MGKIRQAACRGKQRASTGAELWQRAAPFDETGHLALGVETKFVEPLARAWQAIGGRDGIGDVELIEPGAQQFCVEQDGWVGERGDGIPAVSKLLRLLAWLLR